MKKKITILTLLTLIALVSACSHKNTDMTNQTQSNNQVVDTTTGPSWVTDDQSLDTAVKDSWIVIITKDLKTDRELVFEGGLKKGDTGSMGSGRYWVYEGEEEWDGTW